MKRYYDKNGVEITGEVFKEVSLTLEDYYCKLTGFKSTYQVLHNEVRDLAEKVFSILEEHGI